MKKPTLKRMGFGLLQHILAASICVAVAGILFNSYLSVESMNGTKTYYLSPINAEPVFEDSDLFQDIFQTAVSDVTRLVVIKGQLETDGNFDPHKLIDVTKFANRKGTGNGCPITAVYELEDLIKWGKSGAEYTNRVMSMSEFVNYFGPATASENFALDENNQLYFVGFLSNKRDSTSVYSLPMEKGREELTPVEEVMLTYTTEQLEDMAFSYIMARNFKEVSMAREDDGGLTVYVKMLKSRYSTVDDKKALYEYADNWLDYLRLQQNVEESVIHLNENYQQYMNCYELYEENNSNLKYVVRMRTEDGIKTVTNVSELEHMDEGEITEYFTEFRRYLIYYPDSLVFMGNSSLTEDDIYGYMQEYEYAYPETSYIWIGVDTGYEITGDALSYANSIYQKIVPNVGLILSAIGLMSLLWFGIWIYLTVTAGDAYEVKNGEKVQYINSFDHIWTELIILFFALLCYGAFYGINFLKDITNTVYLNGIQTEDMGVSILYDYGYFAVYGFAISLLSTLLWYSLVRRVKMRCLWEGSFMHWLLFSINRAANFVFLHKNMAISTLIPYNIFILTNLAVIWFVSQYQQSKLVSVMIILGIVAFDGVVGILIFKRNTEHIDIVEGIKRIRDGEVEYKLEVDNLHGANREMADAVNNIGEGIRNAVKTSMKDEQMKTDLITNVSHDIKTPLTSIISYIDLLKRLHIHEEPAKSYIEVLDVKAQRLKQLTDDLVEASKISSGNIELQREKINLTELLNQTVGEFSEKLEDQMLQLCFQGNDKDAYIFADSRRMWRIVENLFNNICKYALENTRVYMDLIVENGNIQVAIKNISKRQMNIGPDELTERFIRGDSARTTEGSGLGLSIAKSLTQVQGGTFEIFLDGDLFKVVLGFKEYVDLDNNMEKLEVKIEPDKVNNSDNKTV